MPKMERMHTWNRITPMVGGAITSAAAEAGEGDGGGEGVGDEGGEGVGDEGGGGGGQTAIMARSAQLMR